MRVCTVAHRRATSIDGAPPRPLSVAALTLTEHLRERAVAAHIAGHVGVEGRAHMRVAVQRDGLIESDDRRRGRAGARRLAHGTREGLLVPAWPEGLLLRRRRRRQPQRRCDGRREERAANHNRGI